MQISDLPSILNTALLDEAHFLRLTIVDPRIDDSRWKKIVIRPVLIKGQRHLQWSAFDERKDITSNPLPEAACERLQAVLEAGYRQIHLQSTVEEIHVRVTKRGKVLVSRGKPSRADATPSLEHDRTRRRVVPAGERNPVLEALGIMDAEGRVLPSMQAKYRQVNDFLSLLKPVLDALEPPITLLDCGCGKAYLTFALLDELRCHHPGQASVAGIDRNPEVIVSCRKLAGILGWSDAVFEAVAISEYQPSSAPDIVLSLHACDTATDDAIAYGIRTGARAILAAPCCQHELNRQIDTSTFRPILRHGILRERMADLLTDAFRAQILNLCGYKADVVEFVSPEATAKNLLIRAIRTGLPPSDEQKQAYQELKQFWNLTPYLEKVLNEGGLVLKI